MKIILIKNAIKREDGYIYFIDNGGNVCRDNLIESKKSSDKKGTDY